MSSPSPTRRAILIEGSVGGAIAKMAVPMAWGLIAVISQGVVDSYFAGRLGTRPLAALAIFFPLAMVVSSVSLGVSIGASAVLARLVGAGHWTEVRQTVTQAQLLGLLLMLALMALGYASIDVLFPVLGADEALMPLIRSYALIWYAGAVLFSPGMIGSGSLRALGSTKAASLMMVIAAVANFVLDPILMYGLYGAPELGFAGLAWATLGANLAASLVAGYFLGLREKLLEFGRGAFTGLRANWRKIMKVGAPSALANLITPLSMMALNRLALLHGPAVAGGFGAATRVEALALIVPFALSGCIGPFVGQNFGAGKLERVEDGIKKSLRFIFLYGVAAALVLAILSPLIARQFGDHPDTIATIRLYLWVMPASYGFYGALMVVAACFNALGEGKPNVVLYGLRLVGIYLPLAMLGSWWLGIEGIIIAGLIANMSAGIAALSWHRRAFSRLMRGP